jgi:hypothetical protein
MKTNLVRFAHERKILLTYAFFYLHLAYLTTSSSCSHCTYFLCASRTSLHHLGSTSSLESISYVFLVPSLLLVRFAHTSIPICLPIITYVLITPISCALRAQEIDLITKYFSIPTVCALRAHALKPNPRLTYRNPSLPIQLLTLTLTSQTLISLIS